MTPFYSSRSYIPGGLRLVRNDLDAVVNALFNPAPARRAQQATYPQLNVAEHEDAFEIEAELPGVAAKDLDITVLDKQVTIRGKRERATPGQGAAEGVTVHRAERAAGEFERKLEFSCALDTENVSAELKDGILRLRLAKSPAAKPKRITISG